MSQENLYQDFLNRWETADDFSVVTSGSTGKPKEISISKSRMIRSARRTNEFFGINSSSHLHSAISFEFIGGKMMIARSLVADCILTFETPSLTPYPPGGCIINLMSVVPPQLPSILANEEKFLHVKNILVGGSSISSVLIDGINKSKLRFWESYGMTETVSHIALRSLNSTGSLSNEHFHPLPGVTVFKGEDDCLEIQDGDLHLKTTDLGVVYSDGSFEITGRKDDIIITGAKKVNSLELEKLMIPYISKYECDFFVTSRKHPLWTNEIIIAVKPDGKYDSSSLAEQIKTDIRNIPADKIPVWKKPKDVVILEKFPTTRSGKLIRNLDSPGY